MIRQLTLYVNLLVLGPLGACTVDAPQAGPVQGNLASDTAQPAAQPPPAMDSDAFRARQDALDDGSTQRMSAEEPATEPEAEAEDAPASDEAPPPRAPAPDTDDPNAEPLAAVPAVPAAPLALHAALSAAGLTLGIEGEESADVPKVSALVLHLAGEGVDRTQRCSPAVEQTVDLGNGLPDGIYRYEVSFEREFAPSPPADSTAVDEDGRNAADPDVQARTDLPPLPRASGSFKVERGVLLPPTVEPRPAATEPRGTP